MKFLISLCMVCGLTVFANAVYANSIAFEQLPGHYGGYFSGQYGDYPPEFYTIMVADDFQLSQDIVITRITWWGGYGSTYLPIPNLDNFTIRLFSDHSSEPGTVLQTFYVGNNATRTNTGDWVNPPHEGFSGRMEFQYSFDLPTAFLANAIVHYWLSIVNTPSSDSWLWEASSPGTVQRSFGNPVTGPYGPWKPYLDNMAFQLSPIPEPATLLLLGLGGLIIRKLKFKN